MITFDEARGLILSNVAVLGHERVGLHEALGRVLAVPLAAREAFPSFSASAMDGYAVAMASFGGSGPWTLEVASESRMGHLPDPLVPGSACRILTGAAVPEGADTVVMQEDVTREGTKVTFTTLPRARAHIRYAGEDLKEGDIALAAGTRMGAFQLALAASLDHSEIVVSRRPRVTILCTGDELRSPGEPKRPGTIAECNSIGLRALAEQAGAIVSVGPLVRDDRDATRAAIEDALRGTDVLVTVGGVSVGDHDVVRPALEAAGVSLEFWKVAIKPGKPLAVGRVGRARVLSLPGNPASSMVTFSLFGLPLLRAMQGDRQTLPVTLKAPMAEPIRRSPGRLEFMRATLAMQNGHLAVQALPNQASGAVTSMAWADALAIIPAEATALARGDLVDVLRLADA